MNGERLKQSVGRVETFTRYGLLDGRVVNVSRDTMTEDQPKPADGGSQPPVLRLQFSFGLRNQSFGRNAIDFVPQSERFQVATAMKVRAGKTNFDRYLR